MITAKLTCSAGPAHKAPMQGPCLSRMRAAVLLACLPGLTGCVTVNAPSEPIVIELNINITQEVIYRLAEDAGNTIEENADIF
jgi:YnbE-like lipoprotein